MTAEPFTSIRRTARLAGGLYVSLVPLGVFSFVYVPPVLFVRGDATATARNIVTSEWLFRGAIVSHLLSQILVPFLALAMYRLLRQVDEQRAVAMVVLALLCVPISFVAELNGLAAVRLFSGAGDGAFTTLQLQNQAMLFLDLRQSGGFSPKCSGVSGCWSWDPWSTGRGFFRNCWGLPCLSGERAISSIRECT